MHRANLSDPRIPPGSRFAKYEIEARLKSGGMGTLYKARTLDTGETIVLKVLHEHLARDQEFVRMFENEGRLAAQIHHPKVVRVHEYGTEGELPYLAMEYVDGCSLHDLVTVVGNAAASGNDAASIDDDAPDSGRFKLPVGLALWIVAEAAEALHAAHEATDSKGVGLDIVHRDVSPANILLSWDGEAKLTDFGIAQARTRHTMGAFKGKVRYMAPEHARGDAVDRRADVYSLGTVLWELLAGRPRFSAETDFALLRQVVNPLLISLGGLAGISPAVEAPVRCALAVDREQRFATAARFRQALQETNGGGSREQLAQYLADHADLLKAAATSPQKVPTHTRRISRPSSLPPVRERVDTPPFPFQSSTPPPRRRMRPSTPHTGIAATMPGRTSLVTALVREAPTDNPALSTNQALFERRLSMMGLVGPKLTPALFTAHDERIAYLLNAFITLSALALTGTPASGQLHPRPTNPYHEVTVDGRRTTLNDLDRRLVRARDPRMYAAVIEALHADGWAYAYTGDDLEARLETAMVRLVNSSSFLKLDHESGRTRLRASVRPFTRWLGERARATGVGEDWFDLLVYYAREPLQGELMMARDTPYEVVFTSDMPALEDIEPLSSRLT